MSTRTSPLASIDAHAAVPTWAVARPHRSVPFDADPRSTADDGGVHDPLARGDRLLDRPPVAQRQHPALTTTLKP